MPWGILHMHTKGHGTRLRIIRQDPNNDSDADTTVPCIHRSVGAEPADKQSKQVRMPQRSCCRLTIGLGLGLQHFLESRTYHGPGTNPRTNYCSAYP